MVIIVIIIRSQHDNLNSNHHGYHDDQKHSDKMIMMVNVMMINDISDMMINGTSSGRSMMRAFEAQTEWKPRQKARNLVPTLIIIMMMIMIIFIIIMMMMMMIDIIMMMVIMSMITIRKIKTNRSSTAELRRCSRYKDTNSSLINSMVVTKIKMLMMFDDTCSHQSLVRHLHQASSPLF